VPFREETGVGDSGEIRAVCQDVEQLLPERKREAIRLAGKEEDGIVRGAGRGLLDVRHEGLENRQASRRCVASRHTGLIESGEEDWR
jgi:hypothetical protein